MVSSYEIPTFEYAYIQVGPKSPWYQEVYAYPHDQYIPLDLSSNQRKTLICQASRYTLIVDTLYKRSLDTTLLRHLNFEEAQMALKEFHDRVCGTHVNGPVLAKKLFRTSYY